MADKIDVLDHGFVALRNLAGPTRRVWGDAETFDGVEDEDPYDVRKQRPFDADDTDPANAARMSFNQTDSGRTREQDLKLANYLMRNRHTTPFEMVEVWLEMKLPIFVARQFVRHRTVSINEVSGRYVELPAEWYVPALDAVVLQTTDKKQGGLGIDLTDPEQVGKAERYRDRLDKDCFRSYCNYKDSVADGIAMEQARCHLHVNHYTHWLWKQDLHNIMHFLSLRDHGHAQSEAQAYAKAVDKLLRTYLPATMDLYDQFRRLP